MSRYNPDLDTQKEVSYLLDDMLGQLKYLLGIDEIIPSCEVIDTDSRGVGAATLPRYVQVRIHQYYQEVLYRGFPETINIGDYLSVVHIREGDQYEVLGVGGSSGSIDPVSGVSTPPHFSTGDILLNLHFDRLLFWNDDLTQRYGFETSRRDRAWVWPNSTDYWNRGALYLWPSLWQFRKAYQANRAATNLVTNPSFELDTAGWGTLNCGVARNKEYSYWQIWSLRCLATAQNGRPFYQIVPGAGTYSASVYVRADTSSVDLLVRNVTTAATLGTAVHPGDGQWHRLIVDNFAVGAGDVIQLRIRDTRAAGWTYYYVDGAQMEATAYHTPYIDGDLCDGDGWTGANHASTSDRNYGYIRLSDMVSTISGRDSYSIRCVCQAPYAADYGYWPTNPSPIWWTRGANDNNRIDLRYDSGIQGLRVYINGAVRLSSGALTFTEGEWLDVVVNLNFGLYDSYELWINGELVDSDSTALTAPTLTSWALGIDLVLGSGSVHGWTFAEYTVYNDFLVEDTIKALYLCGPTIDPDSEVEDRVTPAHFVDHTIFSNLNSITATAFGEFGVGRFRFLMAGNRGCGHWHHEIVGSVSLAPGQGEYKLQYYDPRAAAWRDAVGSLITHNSLVTDRFLSGPISMPAQMFEYRPVGRHTVAATQTRCEKSRLYNAYGGDTAL